MLGAALVVLVVLVSTVTHGSVTAIITTALGTMTTLAVAGLLLTRWRSRPTA